MSFPVTTEIRASSLVAEEMPAASLHARVRQRALSDEAWIDIHASGTLRKNRRLGFAWRAQYLEERVAFEFGWEFRSEPSIRVLLGRPFTEGDCSAVTEAGWHIDRYLSMLVFPEDVVQAAYIHVESADGTRVEGIGLVFASTSAAWIGQGRTVFALISVFDSATGRFAAALNPC